MRPSLNRATSHLGTSWKKTSKNNVNYLPKKRWLWEGIGFESDSSAVWTQPGLEAGVCVCVHLPACRMEANIINKMTMEVSSEFSNIKTALVLYTASISSVTLRSVTFLFFNIFILIWDTDSSSILAPLKSHFRALRPSARHNRVLPWLRRRQRRLQHRDRCHSAIVSIRGWLRWYLCRRQLRPPPGFTRSPRWLVQFNSRKRSDSGLPEFVHFLLGTNILTWFTTC